MNSPTNSNTEMLLLELETDPTVNFALQQNDVPLVKALRVKNVSEQIVQGLDVRIWTEPAFAEPWNASIAEIAPGATYNLPALDLELSAQYLLDLTERLVGTIHVEINANGSLQAKHSQRIEVLARDEWSGLRSLPEILTAFVLPNHPAIENILAGAAAVLESWTGDSALNGYQSRSADRVLKMTGAIFITLHKLGISYINPPASFEQQGQKIRLPDRMLANKLGTCLDLTLLMAACLEQAGLHPLVMLIKEHAFAGVWLIDDSFPDSCVDDAASLRKGVDLAELAVFETTLLTHSTATFERVRTEARSRLNQEDTFGCAIDVHRARKRRIRPLPLKAEAGEVLIAIGEQRTGRESSDAAPVLRTTTDRIRLDGTGGDSEAVESPATRLDHWKRKLLDLTLHNRLLNFKDTKKSLPILCPALDKLEDALAKGEAFTIGPRPPEFEAGPRDTELHKQRTGEDLKQAILTEEFKAHRLHADLAPSELERRLIEIYRSARSSMEESGCNPLYLALGFLQWFESKDSDQFHLAPIILIPLELERKLVREGFRIRQGDDEPMINITLLEMLKRDHGLVIEGLDPLPQDAHGIDLQLIIDTVRRAVRDMRKWDVLDQAKIGLLTFTKHLMWRDLQVRSKELMHNRVVEHLVMRPHEPFPDNGDFPDSQRLDETHRLAETYCPLSSDSSQLAAIYAAAENKSFVLEGPPGTGKSQTITNMIAHALTTGKSVLFVSEKMAALGVVHSRLKKIGLEPFCLELHSNKSQKRNVVQSLGAALNFAQAQTPENWEYEAQRLEELRELLNQYPRAMHQPQITGESIFTGLSKLIGLRDEHQIVLRWESLEQIDRRKLDELRTCVANLAALGEACGHPARHVWSAAACEEWSPGFQREVEAAIDSHLQKCPLLDNAVASAGPKIGAQNKSLTLKTLSLLSELAFLLLKAPIPPATLLNEPDWESARRDIAEWIRHGRMRDDFRESVYARYTESILQLDLEQLTLQLEKANAAWWLIGWFKRLFVRSALKKISRGDHRPQMSELADDLKTANALLAEENAIQSVNQRAVALFGSFWRDGQPDWDEVKQLCAWTDNFRNLTMQLCGGDLHKTEQYRKLLLRLLTEGREQLTPNGPVAQVLTKFIAAWKDFDAVKNRLEKLLTLDSEKAWFIANKSKTLEQGREQLNTWRAANSALRGWCSWRAGRRKAIEQNLLPLVQGYEEHALPSPSLRAIFDRAFYQWWIELHFTSNSILKSFYSPEHEFKIKRFQELDEKFLKTTIELIQSRLAANAPFVEEKVKKNSELGILQKELQRKDRGKYKPIRKLFQEIPNLLPKLKPCLLMSPISVAQYLDASHPPFDLVVFDEASQIPIWDAVGVIARGHETVIVGDPKQLPPTNFFNRSDGEEPTDDDSVEDLESILDDCIGARIPWLHLSWHYRSRHESLIAFSNHSYYDNRLFTFPAPDTTAMGVQWRPVPEGVYEKGRSRTNKAEAQAVVAEVLRRLSDSKLSQWSIGIVTFSIAQQTLIEDLLDAARRDQQEIEPFFNTDAAEPVFVKNLESVQGDERDVILFSICYGPDAEGRVSMNFGPLNRDGGERRLNVAITRARREVLVFSTLRAEQIDLARTRARGVADLKLFLEYAERGTSAIAEAITLQHQGEIESPFEQQVYEALIARGHTVHTQVGCSGYRIDLAIVDPAAPGRYLLGIECDGANYHRARTARDRNHLRESVLRDLGWQLHRVWSTDWWHDPQGTLEKIEQAIEMRAREH